jgi:hypothetical protein
MSDQAALLGKVGTPSAMFLILINLVPLAGVFLFGWDAGTILVLYWLESVIIGVLNIPKILLARPESLLNGSPIGFVGNIIIAVFFIFHYGIFTFVHGVFVANFFGGKEIMASLLQGGPVLWSALGFLISHLFSFFVNFINKREYMGRAPNIQMARPYGRVMVMHVVIIFGAMLVTKMGSPIYALILLIVVKTVIDLRAHAKDHETEMVLTA